MGAVTIALDVAAGGGMAQDLTRPAPETALV